VGARVEQVERDSDSISISETSRNKGLCGYPGFEELPDTDQLMKNLNEQYYPCPDRVQNPGEVHLNHKP
jgi:hypothetical protein